MPSMTVKRFWEKVNTEMAAPGARSNVPAGILLRNAMLESLCAQTFNPKIEARRNIYRQEGNSSAKAKKTMKKFCRRHLSVLLKWAEADKKYNDLLAQRLCESVEYQESRARLQATMEKMRQVSKNLENAEMDLELARIKAEIAAADEGSSQSALYQKNFKLIMKQLVRDEKPQDEFLALKTDLINKIKEKQSEETIQAAFKAYFIALTKLKEAIKNSETLKTRWRNEIENAAIFADTLEYVRKLKNITALSAEERLNYNECTKQNDEKKAIVTSLPEIVQAHSVAEEAKRAIAQLLDSKPKIKESLNYVLNYAQCAYRGEAVERFVLSFNPSFQEELKKPKARLPRFWNTVGVRIFKIWTWPDMILTGINEFILTKLDGFVGAQKKNWSHYTKNGAVVILNTIRFLTTYLFASLFDVPLALVGRLMRATKLYVRRPSEEEVMLAGMRTQAKSIMLPLKQAPANDPVITTVHVKPKAAQPVLLITAPHKFVHQAKAVRLSVDESVEAFVKQKVAMPIPPKAIVTVETAEAKDAREVQWHELNCVTEEKYSAQTVRVAAWVNHADKAEPTKRISEIVDIAFNLSPANIFADAFPEEARKSLAAKEHATFGVHEIDRDWLVKFFREYVRKLRVTHELISPYNLSHYLKTELGKLFHVKISALDKVAHDMVDAYKKATEQTYEVPNVKTFVFPSNIFISLAIQQVEGFLEKDKTRPIVITKAWDPHYVQAILLYCKHKNYLCENRTGYAVAEPTPSRVQVFGEMLNDPRNGLLAETLKQS